MCVCVCVCLCVCVCVCVEEGGGFIQELVIKFHAHFEWCSIWYMQGVETPFKWISIKQHGALELKILFHLSCHPLNLRLALGILEIATITVMIVTTKQFCIFPKHWIRMPIII